MRWLVAVSMVVVSVALPTSASASAANGELCAVQTWDQAVVVSVHRAGFLPAEGAPQAQIQAAGALCSQIAGADGWMAADQNYDDWAGQANMCWVTINPGLVGVIHNGAAGFSRAYDMCMSFSQTNPASVYWF